MTLVTHGINHKVKQLLAERCRALQLTPAELTKEVKVTQGQQHQHQMHRHAAENHASSVVQDAVGNPQYGQCFVKCKLRRNTFLPGEVVHGTVQLAVASKDQAWVDVEQAAVQVHGYVKVDPRWITLPSSLRSLFQQNGDLNGNSGPVARYSGLDDDSSASVLASDAAVLLKKDRVFRDEPATFSFSVVLPDELTPTFRGVGIRYAYAVTVSIKRAIPPPPLGAGGRLFGLTRRNRPPAGEAYSTKDLHLPFTVLSEGTGIPGGVADGRDSADGVKWGRVAVAEIEVERLSRCALDSNAERARAGGLVSGTRAVTWNMQGRALEGHQGSMAAISSVDGPCGGGGAWEGVPPPMVYSIRSGENKIGSFVLHKADFCAGDVVLGNFDFSGASTRCLQICACLQLCEENVFSGAAATASGKTSSHKRVVDSSKELSPCVTQSSVALSLPMDATISFTTELVSVSWLLRFEFVMEQPVVESRWSSGSAAAKTSILRWEVPIRVVPPRRSSLSGRGAAGREQGHNAMDATARSVVC